MRLNPMNREALALLSKDELIDLVLSLAARLDELETPARPEQHQQPSRRPAMASKPPAGKMAAHREPAREVGPHRAGEGPSGRDPAPSRRSDAITDQCAIIIRDLPELWFGIDAGDPPAMAPARSICPSPGAGGGASGASLPLRAMWQVKPGPPFPLASPARCTWRRIGAMVVYLSHYQPCPRCLAA